MDTKVMNAKAEYNFEEDMARDIRFNVIAYIPPIIKNGLSVDKWKKTKSGDYYLYKACTPGWYIPVNETTRIEMFRGKDYEHLCAFMPGNNSFYFVDDRYFHNLVLSKSFKNLHASCSIKCCKKFFRIYRKYNENATEEGYIRFNVYAKKSDIWAYYLKVKNDINKLFGEDIDFESFMFMHNIEYVM